MARPKKAVRDLVFRRLEADANTAAVPRSSPIRVSRWSMSGPAAAKATNGRETWRFSCQGCNNNKYSQTTVRDPVSDQQVRLFNPRRDKWATHFAWTDDATQILGPTAIGRTTVDALELNRQTLINLRRVLVKAGEHPPED